MGWPTCTKRALFTGGAGGPDREGLCAVPFMMNVMCHCHGTVIQGWFSQKLGACFSPVTLILYWGWNGSFTVK